MSVVDETCGDKGADHVRWTGYVQPGDLNSMSNRVDSCFRSTIKGSNTSFYKKVVVFKIQTRQKSGLIVSHRLFGNPIIQNIIEQL